LQPIRLQQHGYEGQDGPKHPEEDIRQRNGQQQFAETTPWHSSLKVPAIIVGILVRGLLTMDFPRTWGILVGHGRRMEAHGATVEVTLGAVHLAELIFVLNPLKLLFVGHSIAPGSHLHPLGEKQPHEQRKNRQHEQDAEHGV
jgi:hypothetical protein